MRRLCPLVAAWVVVTQALLSGSPTLPADGPSRELVLKWRARLSELEELQTTFRGSLSGASLSELGRVGFIFEQARGASRTFLDEDDQAFVLAAVRGQPPEELERNLPAIINYVKLSTAAPAMHAYAGPRQPLLGTRRGFGTILRMEKAVADFRSRQLARLRAGQTSAAYVLTTANLGRLGRNTTYRQLRWAFWDGERHYIQQNDLLGYGFFTGSLAALAAITAFVRRKAGAGFSDLSLLAPAEPPTLQRG